MTEECRALAEKNAYHIEDLLRIMEILRGEDGCPWDRAQTHKDLRKNLIEEAYEVADAIDREDPASMQEELGDLLLQIVFHARMETEQGGFDFDRVANDICLKMIRRHPHIFGGAPADPGAAGAYENWEAIKRSEKGHKSCTEELESVARTLPALMRAQKLLRKAGKAGYYRPGEREAFYLALPEAAAKKALGEELQAICYAAAQLGLDAEELLDAENRALIQRVKQEEEREEHTDGIGRDAGG